MATYIINAFYDKKAWIIFALYFLWNNCFNFYIFQGNFVYGEMKEIVMLGICFVMASYVMKKQETSIATLVKCILIMFICSIGVGLYFWHQDPYQGLRGILATYMPLLTFFLLSKKNISTQTVVNSFILICIFHGIAQVIDIATFPHHIFGNSGREDIERSLKEMENRGTYRFLIPGADSVVFLIFFIIVSFRNNIKAFLWLIPLIALLFIRGTRTPALATLLLAIVYWVWKMENIRTKAIAFAFILISIIFIRNNLHSEDSILNKYIELTETQIESNTEGNENVRLLMSIYYLTDFNGGNSGKDIFGNGVPGIKGAYHDKVQQLSDDLGFYTCDVGFVQIFSEFGYVGLIIYLILLIAVLCTRIDSRYDYAKLMVIYCFLILPTNAMLLRNPIILAFTLYIIHQTRLERLWYEYIDYCCVNCELYEDKCEYYCKGCDLYFSSNESISYEKEHVSNNHNS